MDATAATETVAVVPVTPKHEQALLYREPSGRPTRMRGRCWSGRGGLLLVVARVAVRVFHASGSAQARRWPSRWRQRWSRSPPVPRRRVSPSLPQVLSWRTLRGGRSDARRERTCSRPPGKVETPGSVARRRRVRSCRRYTQASCTSRRPPASEGAEGREQRQRRRHGSGQEGSNRYSPGRPSIRRRPDEKHASKAVHLKSTRLCLLLAAPG